MPTAVFEVKQQMKKKVTPLPMHSSDVRALFSGSSAHQVFIFRRSHTSAAVPAISVELHDGVCPQSRLIHAKQMGETRVFSQQHTVHKDPILGPLVHFFF